MIVLLGFVVGCTMPATIVKTSDIRPGISISGAPANSLLYVDGINMGDASQYNGHPNILTVESGTHKVVIINDNKVVFEKTVFVESELRNIIVR
jgi:hypothetical protein